MADSNKTKQEKARMLRYKKPIARDLNLETIKETLWDIQEECESVHWYVDSDDDTLVNALDGNEDEAYEFRMMFADLCAECDQMLEDLQCEWVPDCFDKLFVAAGAGESYGGLLGFDTYEQDYFGLSCADIYAEDESKKYLKTLTKDNLIAAIRQCFRIYSSYIGLSHRYDCLKAALDVLRDENTGYLQMVKRVEELYNELDADAYYKYGIAYQNFDNFTNNLPQDAWLQ